MEFVIGDVGGVAGKGRQEDMLVMFVWFWWVCLVSVDWLDVLVCLIVCFQAKLGVDMFVAVPKSGDTTQAYMSLTSRLPSHSYLSTAASQDFTPVPKLLVTHQMPGIPHAPSPLK